MRENSYSNANNVLSIKYNNLIEKDEKRIALLFSAYFSYTIVTAAVNAIVNLFAPNTPIDTIICTMVFAVFIFFAIGPIMRKINMQDLSFLIICGLVYLYNMFVYYENYDYLLGSMPKFFFLVLPLFLLGKSITNYKILLEYFVKTSNYMVWVALTYYLVLIVNGKELHEDHMSFAYYVLPFVIIRFYILIKGFSVKNFIYFAVAAFTMILTGTRGPFLCLVISIILFVLCGTSNPGKKIMWAVMLGGFVLFFFSNAFIRVLEGINDFLLRYDIENRIIEKLLEQEFFDGSGRENILASVRNAIMEKPIFGSGIYADRVRFGTYAHNFFYELLLHFGCIVGFIIFIVVTLQVCKAIFTSKNSYNVIAILCVSCIYVKLYVSGSYLEEPNFFLMLGIVFSTTTIEPVAKVDGKRVS